MEPKNLLIGAVSAVALVAAAIALTDPLSAVAADTRTKVISTTQVASVADWDAVHFYATRLSDGGFGDVRMQICGHAGFNTDAGIVMADPTCYEQRLGLRDGGLAAKAPHIADGGALEFWVTQEGFR